MNTKTTITRIAGLRLWLAIVALGAVIAVSLSAARWQWNRAQEKAQLAQRLAQVATLPPVSAEEILSLARADLAWRPALLNGIWRHEDSVLVGPRQVQGQPAALLITPLELRSGAAVAVLRGWVPLGRPGDTKPGLPVEPKAVAIQGQLIERIPRALELARPSEAPRRALVQAGRLELDQMPLQANFNPRDWPSDRGYRLLDWVLRQEGPAEGPLSRHWDPEPVDVDKHRGYMLQWLSFAAIASIALGVILVKQFYPSSRR